LSLIGEIRHAQRKMLSSTQLRELLEFGTMTNTHEGRD